MTRIAGLKDSPGKHDVTTFNIETVLNLEAKTVREEKRTGFKPSGAPRDFVLDTMDKSNLGERRG